MVIDASAVVAILEDEPDADRLASLIRRAQTRWMSAVTFLEAGIVLDQRVRRTPEATRDQLSDLVDAARIALVPFTAAHAQMARQAYRRYGKGRHPAGLNFGDCMSYALAKSLDEPLLFKGTDFALTDIRVVA